MKVLLDENVPVRLRHFLPGHEVATVSYLGWKGVRNGRLLAQAADNGFAALITMDSAMSSQQRRDVPVAILVMHAVSNDLESLLPLVSELQRCLSKVSAGEIVNIGPMKASG